MGGGPFLYYLKDNLKYSGLIVPTLDTSQRGGGSLGEYGFTAAVQEREGRVILWTRCRERAD